MVLSLTLPRPLPVDPDDVNSNTITRIIFNASLPNFI